MCGIVGQYEFDKTTQIDEVCLKQSCDLMLHRGPDDVGIYVNGNIGLAMRRLSIIDLSTGNQPIHNEDKSIWVVSNGEIYNYKELRSDLKKRNHTFYTNSDTEVLVHLYEEDGEALVNKLNGMFSFALWDKSRENLLLARDRLGIKPLFYYADSQRLLFGSEIKSILKFSEVDRSIDFTALHNYLSLNSVPAPQTIYKNIMKLLPGHLLVCRQGMITIKEYWDIDYSQDKSQQPLEFYTETILGLLRNSIKRRLISDVPLGVLLSGGIDSSAITALMSELSTSPVKTFSVGFEDHSFNELPFARQIAKKFGTEHHELVVKPTVDLFPKIVSHFEEPFADNSAFPTYLISKFAKDYVTVVLSGEGGDEVFAGYETYLAYYYANLYRRLPKYFSQNLIPSIVQKLPVSEKKVSFDYKAKRFVKSALLSAEVAHYHWKTIFDEKEKRQLYSTEMNHFFEGLDTYKVYERYYKTANAVVGLDKLLYVDAKTWLANDCLVKVDRMSMANSQEARVPFLDHTLVEFLATVPADIKMKYFQKKYLLRKALRNILPNCILSRPKKGFIMPVNIWLKNEFRSLCLDLLSPAQIKKVGFFNPQTVSTLIKEHFDEVQDHNRKIWGLLNFMLWHEMFMDHPSF